MVHSAAAVLEIHVNHDEARAIDSRPIYNNEKLLYDGNENEVNNEFYQRTQNNILNNFIILTPKQQLNQLKLALIVC